MAVSELGMENQVWCPERGIGKGRERVTRGMSIETVKRDAEETGTLGLF